MNLQKMFKHRIQIAESKKYLKWWNENKKRNGHDGHHILGSFTGKKINDYLIANVEHGKHISKPETIDFDEALLEAVNNLIDYVKELEK